MGSNDTLTIENNHINSTETAINISSLAVLQNIILKNNIINVNSTKIAHGINLETPINSNMITRNIIFNNTIVTNYFSSDGINLDSSRTLVMYNNISNNIINTSGSNSVGISLLGSGINTNNVTNNVIRSVGKGILLHAATYNVFATNVYNNTVYVEGVSANGIHLSGRDILNSSVTFNNILATGEGCRGIYLWTASRTIDNTSVISNDILSNGSGIAIDSFGFTNLTISNNRILSNSSHIKSNVSGESNIFANWFGTNDLNEINNSNVLIDNYYIMVLNSSIVNGSNVPLGDTVNYNYYFALNDSSNNDLNLLPDFDVSVKLINGTVDTFNVKEGIKQWSSFIDNVGLLEVDVYSKNSHQDDALITNWLINIPKILSSLTVSPVSGSVNRSVELLASLKDSDNNPIIGKEVLIFMLMKIQVIILTIIQIIIKIKIIIKPIIRNMRVIKII